MQKWQQSSRAWACSLLLAALAAVPTHAHACDTLVAAGPESTCVVGVGFSGNKGVWFEMSAAQDVLRKMRIYPELELQVQKFSFTNSLYEKETVAQRNTIALLENTQANLRKQVELANKDAREAREAYVSSNRWYKSPLFWGIVMFITGAAVQNACCSGK